MSIRINNKIIAGNSGEAKSTSYRYVGEIFQSAIPIDDIKVACLDGHKIYSDEGYGSFMQHLISQSVLYPQLVCTEEVWQEKVTQYGSWGQFVINTQENSVRLPKIAGFVQGLNTLEDLASLLEAGLPDHAHTLSLKYDTASGSGYDKLANYGSTRNYTTDKASASNPIYGNSTTVQPQAIQYPYYIVLATGVVQEINVKKEVELNNPFFFGQSQYYENEPNNLSWLKSEGQWNNGSIYESFYEWLVNSYNDTESGVNVKLNSEIYTDYDFVINQQEGKFRLPLLNGEESLVSDKYEDFEIITHPHTYKAPANGWYTLHRGTAISGIDSITLTNETNNIRSSSETCNGHGIRVYIPVSREDIIDIRCSTSEWNTDIDVFRFIYAKGNGSLYYYVGEVVQNANIINVSKLRDEVKELKDFITSDKEEDKEEGEEESSGNIVSIVEEYVNGNEGYRIYSNGFFEQWGYIEQLTSSSSDVTITFSKPLSLYKNFDMLYIVEDIFVPSYTYTLFETSTYAEAHYYNQVFAGGPYLALYGNISGSNYWSYVHSTSITGFKAIHPAKDAALVGGMLSSWKDSKQPYFKGIHWHMCGYIV